MARYTEDRGRFHVAYGHDHACGWFVQVFDREADPPDTPIIDLDEAFNGLTYEDLRRIAELYGAVRVDERL